MSFTHSIPPCKGCENRHTGCHSECSEYIEWSTSRQKAEAKARAVYSAENEIDNYKILRIRKHYRKLGK